jgi:hypothetical protein
MANACFPSEWMRVTDMNQCNALFPVAENPRMAAGGPLTDDVFKCQLKPVTAKDYRQPLTGAQLVILKDVFPSGVCDYSKPGVGQAPLAGTWLSYPFDGSQLALTIAPATTGAITTTAAADMPSRIAQAQQTLVALGYEPGGTDGIMGPKTRAAVMEFQKDKGLMPTGQVNDDLLFALQSAR